MNASVGTAASGLIDYSSSLWQGCLAAKAR